MKNNTFIIDNIIDLCKQRGLTLYKLAQQTGMPYTTLNSMIKQRRLPSIRTLTKICSVFDMSLSQFFLLIEQQQGIDQSDSSNDELMALWTGLDDQSKDLAMGYIYMLAKREIPIDKEGK